jgi:hypothetical protein
MSPRWLRRGGGPVDSRAPLEGATLTTNDPLTRLRELAANAFRMLVGRPPLLILTPVLQPPSRPSKLRGSTEPLVRVDEILLARGLLAVDGDLVEVQSPG